ncbi:MULTISPECIES: chemotaxis protein CheC [Lachnospira]|jgi:chemotaxis protein CheC|uniref:Chemotaxis protein CheC n=1 Tax=Lachnospira multipara TaxID=28051 RepID=A0A1H5UPR1_9FIRM|nr:MULTISPECIES: chemotaxis protein CheC [Lachnospira]MBQ2472866.1 chemotaxis protein CheC [Lachnospira sp.]SEF77016.1 chemotaxis protein CheC [Lachnospira multipara]
MSKINLEELSDMQFDILKEIGNIGAGNATTALAKMLQMKMDMSVPKVALLPFKDISQLIGSEDQIVVGILLDMGGEINGMMMFLFDTKSAHHLVNKLMMQEDVVDDYATDFTEMEMSAISEIGNIVSGSYLTALASLTNLKVQASVPSLTVDMIGALMSVPASEFGKYGDKLLLIQSQFGEEGYVNGYFMLIPELESYDKILSALGM